jgi:hypothetical protein
MNNLIQIAQIMKNPQAFLQQAMQSGNPMVRNAIEMYQRGDKEGLNEMAQNLCKERGINMQEMEQKIKSQLGL